MRRRIAHGLASVLFVVSLGAAQGPNSSGSKDTQVTLPNQALAEAKAEPARINHRAAYQVGTASWYGEYFVGRATASGEPYNMYDLTAAHPSLPLGTWVRVTNLHNGRRVYVRINDRGPIVPGRIIDLSYSAAQSLHFATKGLERVRLDVVAPRKSQPQQVAMLHPVAY
ncbi:MAG: septal ring lytic transglycosylase RlpA family protein [Terriglobales bacterium]